MRSGRSAASATLREAVSRRPLVSNPMKGARTLLTTLLLVVDTLLRCFRANSDSCLPSAGVR